MFKLTNLSSETKSANLVESNLKKLKTLFSEAFNEDLVDFEVLKELLGGTGNEREEKYGLTWFGKRQARQAALIPSSGTLLPVPSDSVNWAETNNLILEGDNLEVLKLLQKGYSGKVKMIYIDPPYNTGNDFIYPDNYTENLQTYLEYTGQVDSAGKKFSNNTDTDGRFHSKWLNMMYPRLYLARNLLRDDGVIFISIGQAELANLVHMSNEVFGEENKIAICTRVMKTGGQKGKFFSPNTDYVVIYSKNIEFVPEFRDSLSEGLIDKVYTQVETEGPRTGERYRSMGLYQPTLDSRANQRYFIKCPDGELVIPPGSTMPTELIDGGKIKPVAGDGVWRWTFSRLDEERKIGNILFKDTGTSPLVNAQGEPSRWNIYTKIWLKDRLEEGSVPLDIFQKFENRHSAKELNELGIPFDFAKPSELISYLATICGTTNDDIICDFFAGSGTVAHSVLELNKQDNGNRRFILVQLPEPLSNDENAQKPAADFCKSIGKPLNVAEITKERVRRVIERLNEQDSTKLELKTKNPVDRGFKVFRLANSNIQAWDPDRKNLVESLTTAIENLNKKRSDEDLLFELLLKLGLELTVPIEQKSFDKHVVYSIGGGVLLVCLDTSISGDDVESLSMEIISWHKLLAPIGESTCVFRDSAFVDDVAKTNLTSILQQYGLENIKSL